MEKPIGQPLTFDLVPEADAFVTPGASNESADQNFGSAGGLSVSPPEAAKGEHQSLLRFQLAEAHDAFNETFGLGQWEIEMAEVRLVLTDPRNPIFNSNNPGQYRIAWLAEDGWIEGSGRPAMPSDEGIAWTGFTAILSGANLGEDLGPFDYDGSSEGIFMNSLTLTSSFLADLENDGKVSFRVFATENGASLVFNSRNVGNESSRPRLSMTAAPKTIVSPSSPQLAISIKDASAFELSWESTSGISYQLQSRESLDATEWMNHGPVIVATQGQDRQAIEVPVSPDEGGLFFRIALIEP